MSTAVWTNRLELNSVADTALKIATRSWFVVAVIGQLVFAFTVASFYGLAAARGNLQAWNKTLPHDNSQRSASAYSANPGSLSHLSSLEWADICADRFHNGYHWPLFGIVREKHRRRCYTYMGNKPQAVANYQTSLQLNPKNRNAVQMLQKLSAP